MQIEVKNHDRDYMLVIPSRERADWLDTHVFSTVRQTFHLKPEVWVREDDSQRDRYYDFLFKWELLPTIYDGSGILGAAQTYDRIIGEAIRRGVKKLLILDDDLKFVMDNPWPGQKPDFLPCEPPMIDALFQHIVDLVCWENPMLSFTPIMTRSLPHIITYCKPMMMAYAIFVPHFAEHPDHRFWKGKRIEARCDLALTLQLLTEGYLTGFMNTCFIPDNVNHPGGCSVYRDLEFEKESVAWLKSRYSPFVRVKQKKGWVNDPDVVRPSVHISWKKAFNREDFALHFGVDPNEWAKAKIAEYQNTYSKFVEELRCDN